MKKPTISMAVLLGIIILFTGSTGFDENQQKDENITTIYMEWAGTTPEGKIEVFNGKLSHLFLVEGRGKVTGTEFYFKPGKRYRLGVSLKDVHLQPGPGATVITVDTKEKGFSFVLRDVTSRSPIYIPGYEVAVLPAGDNRSLSEIGGEASASGLKTKLKQIEEEPEESYDNASKHTRSQGVPTWLGVSRDFNLFEVDFGLNHFDKGMESIRPKRANQHVRLPELNNAPVTYRFAMGRGIGVVKDVSRSLEKGFLPILHADLRDEDILYKTRTFVTLEGAPLRSENLRGTHYLVADGYSGGHTFTAEQQKEFEKQEKTELGLEKTTVLCFQAKAVNTSKALRYAWFKFPESSNGQFKAADGFGLFSDDRVFCISRLNGKPAPCEEISVLLAPGDSAVFEFYIPHTPATRDRALKISAWDFEDQFEGCRSFWENKLFSASRVRLPEKRIEEMVYAGLLHLDLISYGLEPEGTLAPTIGVYSPIGSESSPIIQFMNSMGWHETARRSVQFFLDKQHENGFMQNFGGYMLETGAALFTMGEYFRYTRDTEFVKKNKPKILKACEYLISEQDSNKCSDLKGKGYGMMVGKVADKNDHFHSFMLNGYNYLGLSRSAEMLAGIDPVMAERIRLHAEELKGNIRESFFAAMKRSPVMPLGDGTWVPSVPPWPDTQWLPQLFLEPHKMYSHAHFTVRYATTGPLYLVYQEVISPDEPAAASMLAFHAEHLYQRNTVFSQPYYSRHDWLQLKRGMVKPFLKTYYNTFPAISDRETYTFWEHIHQVSPHKTHEEAWFLMQTRWMLYLEEGKTLKLLSGVPRAWLENGKTISLENVASYFGPLSFQVKSTVEKGFIEATIDCTTDRKPKDVIVRLPHPSGRKPVKVSGGVYDENTETVHVPLFTGHVRIKLTY